MSKERDELAATVRALLTQHAPPPASATDAPGGYDAGLWKRLLDLGLGELAVPEELGGVGGDYLDCHAVLVELGRALVATPYPATLIATQAALLAGGGSGETVVMDGFVARETVDGWVVSGHCEYVLDGARSERLLVVDGSALFEVEGRALERRVHPTMDQAIHLAAVGGERVPAVHRGQVDRARLTDLGVIATTADQIGGARRCLEMTVQYARERVQFGRPIGSFQAVKHRLADLLVLVEAAESASWAAAEAWAANDDTSTLARVAGSYCGEMYEQVVAESVQLHGGIAITWEHPAHRYFKHAHTTATLFGTPAGHRRALSLIDRAS